MARKTLFDTDFAKISGLENMAPQVVKYLVDNRNCALDAGAMRNIYQMRALLPSAFNNIFDHLLNSEKLNSVFAPIHPDFGVVPELLTIVDITLDLEQIKENHVLKSMPEFYGKVLINLSPILRVSKTVPIHFSITDVNAMHALFTRAALVASYQDSDGWLTPSLNLFTVKTYSMLISNILAKQYDLTMLEQTTISAVFALYMCQALSDKNDSLEMPALFNRCTFLASQNSTLVNLARSMEHLSKTGLTIGSMCQLVAELGPPRMNTFNPTILYRSIASMGTSSTQMMLALEYPPYWVYQLLLSISNAKTRMMFELKSSRLLNDCKAFAYELNTSRQFIDSINR